MHRVLVAVVSLACCILASVTAATTAGPTDPGERLIDELDTHIQRRFLDIDKRFGISRIETPGDHHEALRRRFTPENEDEERTVASLNSARLNVVIYLAGRMSLTAPALLVFNTSAPRAALPMGFRRAIAGPVTVAPVARTGVPPPPLQREPPAARDLFDEGRSAFARFQTEATHSFSRDGWSFIARPVRASSDRCLRCHKSATPDPSKGSTPLALGDVLGVVLYGYAPR